MAYEFSKLAEGFKAEGLEVAEEAAKKAVNVVFNWLEQSAKESANPYDDLLLVALPLAKKNVLDLAEKINPADNPA